MPSSELRRGYKSDRRGFVSGNFSIAARSNDGLLDRVVRGEDFSGLGKVVSGFEGDFVSFNQLRILAELSINPIQRRFQRAVVKPIEHPQGKEVFRASDFLTGQFHVPFERVHVQGRKTS